MGPVHFWTIGIVMQNVGDLGDWCFGSYFDDTHKHGHKQAGGMIHFGTRFADAPNTRCKCHPVDRDDFCGLKNEWKDAYDDWNYQEIMHKIVYYSIFLFCFPVNASKHSLRVSSPKMYNSVIIFSLSCLCKPVLVLKNIGIKSVLVLIDIHCMDNLKNLKYHLLCYIIYFFDEKHLKQHKFTRKQNWIRH